MKAFFDRSEAGIRLSEILAPKYQDANALIIGIPRGGVVVGYEVARALNGELSTVITKKLPHPNNPEVAIGAVSEDGLVYLTPLGESFDEATIIQLVKTQTREIESRINRFRWGKPLPNMKNRKVIIVDDGIATGATILPAIGLCKRRGAAKVIVAAPVAGRNFAPEITQKADEIVIIEQPDDFHAVGQVYEDFHHLSDLEVTALLKDESVIRH